MAKTSHKPFEKDQPAGGAGARTDQPDHVNYFAVGDSGERFSFVRDWVERKIRGHLMRAGERAGLG